MHLFSTILVETINEKLFWKKSKISSFHQFGSIFQNFAQNRSESDRKSENLDSGCHLDIEIAKVGDRMPKNMFTGVICTYLVPCWSKPSMKNSFGRSRKLRFFTILGPLSRISLRTVRGLTESQRASIRTAIWISKSPNWAIAW